MFNRTRSPREAADSAGDALDGILADLQAASGPTVPAGPAGPTAPVAPAAPAVSAGTPPPPPAPPVGDVLGTPDTTGTTGTTDPADTTGGDPWPTHAAALRATREAQLKAEEMLTLASRSRLAATEQAEQIITEARETAERVREAAERDAEQRRHEATAWIAGQRTAVEDLVAQARAALAEEAEQTRADAVREALADAERRAEEHRVEAEARAERDADALRAGARAALEQARAVAIDLQTSLQSLSEGLVSATATTTEKLALIDLLLVQSRHVEGAGRPAVRDELIPTHELIPVVPPVVDQEPAPEADLEADSEVAPLGEEPSPTTASSPWQHSGSSWMFSGQPRELGAMFRDRVDGR